MFPRIVFGLALIVPWAAGCRSGQRAPYQSRGAIAVEMRSPAGEAVWEGMKDTLRRSRLTLDRVDRRGGVITTRPELSRHWFEFWRRDARTFHDKFESSVNPIRRWVEVHVEPADDDGGSTVEVAVHKQRLSSPDRMFNSSGAAYQFFGEALPSTTGAPRVSRADERWLDLGRDPALEDYLLQKFLALAANVPGGEGTGPAAATP